MPARTDGQESLTVPATLDRLHEIEHFVLERARCSGLPEQTCRRLSLVLEEMVVNVVEYAYGQERGVLEVYCLRTGSDYPRFCVTLVDHGRPFDPLNGRRPDLQLGVEDRPVGGLGIFLAREMADSFSYERKGKSNHLEFCFDLPLS